VFDRLAEYLHRSKEVRSTVVSALIYPAILAVVALLSVAVDLGTSGRASDAKRAALDRRIVRGVPIRGGGGGGQRGLRRRLETELNEAEASLEEQVRGARASAAASASAHGPESESAYETQTARTAPSLSASSASAGRVTPTARARGVVWDSDVQGMGALPGTVRSSPRTAEPQVAPRTAEPSLGFDDESAWDGDGGAGGRQTMSAFSRALASVDGTDRDGISDRKRKLYPARPRSLIAQQA
jgi:hypothetical protein